MQPFRTPQYPPRPPEVDTSELEQLSLKKRNRTRNMLIGVVVGTFLIPALIGGYLVGGDWWVQYKWKKGAPERERQAAAEAEARRAREEAHDAEIKRRTFPLSPAERERAAPALDLADKRIAQHESALAKAWPDIVSAKIRPLAGSTKCPVEIPKPFVVARDDDPGTTYVDKSDDSELTWLYFDARDTPRAKDMAKLTANTLKTTAPSLEAVRGFTAISPPPAPSWTGDLAKNVIGRRQRIDAPMLDTDHEEFVTHCEALAEAAQPKTLLRRYMYLAMIEVWVRPVLSGSREYDSGFIAAHGYVWDSNEDKVACTALVTASNSDAIRGFDLNAGSLNRDLRLQFEKKLADTLREAAPVAAAKSR